MTTQYQQQMNSIKARLAKNEIKEETEIKEKTTSTVNPDHVPCNICHSYCFGDCQAYD